MGHQADSIDISRWGTKGSKVKIPKEFRYFSIFVGRVIFGLPDRLAWIFSGLGRSTGGYRRASSCLAMYLAKTSVSKCTASPD
jgi:hypothetical protein